jgi:hypothetical protein
MTDSRPQTQQTPELAPPRWKRLLLLLARVGYGLVATIVITSALVVALAQTQMARDFLTARLVGLVNSNIAGSFQCGAISIDVFHGVVISRPLLSVRGRPLLSADEISVSYDVAALVGKTLAVNRIELSSPRINLQRGRDSVWNISRFLLPPDTTTAPPPDLVIRLRSLVITQGVINEDDQTAQRPVDGRFDPLHLALRNVELRASALIDLRARDYTIGIDHCSFHDLRQEPLNVLELLLAARIRPQGISVPLLSITTPTSHVNLSASVDGLDVEADGIDGETFRRHPLRATVDAGRVNGRDVLYVVPGLDIVGEYSLKANVTYRGDRVAVDAMDLTAGDGRLRGAVLVTSLNDQKKLGLDISLTESSIRYDDVRRRMRFIGLPELPFLSRSSAKYIRLKGHPSDSLRFEADIADRPGHAVGTMTLYLGGPQLGYRANVEITGGEPAVFVPDLERSSINGRFDVSGTGFLPSELSGVYKFTLRPSVVLGRNVSFASMDMVAERPGVLTFNAAEMTFGLERPDSLTAFFEPAQPRSIDLAGKLDLSNMERPIYQLTTSFTSLNLADLLRDEALPNILSGSCTVDGSGAELDSILGRLTARIDEFALRDRALLPFEVTLVSSLQGAERRVELAAPFGSASLSGDFLPSALIEGMSDVIGALAQEVGVRMQPFSRRQEARFMPSRVGAFTPLDVRFEVDVRDVSPVNIALDEMTISTRARCRGRIAGTPAQIAVEFDEVEITDLLVRTDSLVIASDPTSFSGRLLVAWRDSLMTVDNILLRASSGGKTSINDLMIKRPEFWLEGGGRDFRMRAEADVNGIDAYAAAAVMSTPDSLRLDVDSLHVVLDGKKGLDWRSIRRSSLRVSDAEMTVADLLVRRQNAELVAIDGLVSAERFRDLRVRLSGFAIPDLRRFVSLPDGHPVTYLKGTVSKLDLIVNGSWKQPEHLMRVDADDLTYNGELIGSLVASASYRDQDIVGTMTIRNPRLLNEKSALIVAINHIPLDLSLSTVKQRWVMDKPIDIDLTATNLALAAVEPFLPAVEKVQGVGNGYVTIKGTPRDIELGGRAWFKNASFVASPTNIQYRAEGSLHLDGSKLFLDTITVRNYPRDRRNGIAHAEGTVTFDGLSVQRVDFEVRSPGILVMNKGSQARNPKIFGDVVIANGKGGPIKFFGVLDEPHLEGDVDVLFADIVFPQEREGAKARYTSFIYNRSADSVKRFNSIMDVLQQDTAKMAATLLKDGLQDVGKVVENVIKTTTASFSDILRYDLNVYLKGRTLMTMVFGVFEILIADLEPVDATIPLVFTGRFVDNSTNLRGRVRVKDGTSTYKFYKPFLASGTLDFTLGGLSNPTLDLTAVYRDRRFVNERPEDFRVEIAITGTKQKPIARWSVYRNDRKQQGDSAKITGDALMLILLGRTQDELVSTGQGNLVGEVNASLSAVATSALGDLLSGIGGIVQSVQMDLGAEFSQTRLTVSGQLWSDVSYRLTGQVSDFSGNSTITVTIPFTVINNSDAMRYLKLDVSRSVNNTGNITRFQRLWEIKFGARLP